MEISQALFLIVTFVVGYASAEVSRWLADRRHAADIERIHASYATVLTAKANIEQYGRPVLPEAVTQDVEPAPEERAAFEASAEAVEHGAKEIFDSYQALGMPVTMEECREEARGIILGVMAPPPATMVGLLD